MVPQFDLLASSWCIWIVSCVRERVGAPEKDVRPRTTIICATISKAHLSSKASQRPDTEPLLKRERLLSRLAAYNQSSDLEEEDFNEVRMSERRVKKLKRMVSLLEPCNEPTPSGHKQRKVESMGEKPRATTRKRMLACLDPYNQRSRREEKKERGYLKRLEKRRKASKQKSSRSVTNNLRSRRAKKERRFEKTQETRRSRASKGRTCCGAWKPTTPYPHCRLKPAGNIPGEKLSGETAPNEAAVSGENKYIAHMSQS